MRAVLSHVICPSLEVFIIEVFVVGASTQAGSGCSLRSVAPPLARHVDINRQLIVPHGKVRQCIRVALLFDKQRPLRRAHILHRLEHFGGASGSPVRSVAPRFSRLRSIMRP